MPESATARQRAPRTPVAPINFDVTGSAEFLGVSVPTIWRLLRDGTLPRVKLRGRTVIPRSACEALMRRAEVA